MFTANENFFNYFPSLLASTRIASRVYIRQYCFEISTENLFATLCSALKYPTLLQTGIYLYSRSSPSSPTLTSVNTLSISLSLLHLALCSLSLVFNCSFWCNYQNCLKIHFDLNYHLHFYSSTSIFFVFQQIPNKNQLKW